MKKLLTTLAITLSLFGCSSDANIASRNLSQAADNFEINRRIVFYNGITGEYILTIEGLCSLGNEDKTGRITVTCKDSANSYKKHFLGLSNNVTFFAEQIESNKVSVYNYKVIFKPASIIPNIDVKL